MKYKIMTLTERCSSFSPLHFISSLLLTLEVVTPSCNQDETLYQQVQDVNGDRWKDSGFLMRLSDCKTRLKSADLQSPYVIILVNII